MKKKSILKGFQNKPIGSIPNFPLYFSGVRKGKTISLPLSPHSLDDNPLGPILCKRKQYTPWRLLKFQHASRGCKSQRCKWQIIVRTQYDGQNTSLQAILP